MRSILILFVLLISKNSFSQKKSSDYYITKNIDTIYEIIYSKNTPQKFYTINSLGKKIKITSKNVIEFRKSNFNYYLKKKRKVTFNDSKKAFLKLIIDGEAKLYEYERATPTNHGHLYQTFYYIERNNELDLINSHRFYQIIERFLPENKSLLTLIKNKELKSKDVEYVVNYFNDNFK